MPGFAPIGAVPFGALPGSILPFEGFTDAHASATASLNVEHHLSAAATATATCTGPLNLGIQAIGNAEASASATISTTPYKGASAFAGLNVAKMMGAATIAQPIATGALDAQHHLAVAVSATPAFLSAALWSGQPYLRLNEVVLLVGI